MLCGNCGHEMGDHGQFYPGSPDRDWAPVTKCQWCGFGSDKLCCEHEHNARRLERIEEAGEIILRACARYIMPPLVVERAMIYVDEIDRQSGGRAQ